VKQECARGVHDTLLPSPWIVRYAHLVGVGARVLDVASGAGRHARYFAGRGCRVVAVDRDREALATLDGVAGVAGVETRVADLELGTWPLGDERYDAIVVTNYLHRPLFPFLRAALAGGGVLLYETFARGNEAFGRPSRPDFLLEPNELFRLAEDQGLTVIAFEQGLVVEGRSAVVQRLAAVESSRAWPPTLDPG